MRLSVWFPMVWMIELHKKQFEKTHLKRKFTSLGKNLFDAN